MFHKVPQTSQIRFRRRNHMSGAPLSCDELNIVTTADGLRELSVMVPYVAGILQILKVVNVVT